MAQVEHNDVDGATGEQHLVTKEEAVSHCVDAATRAALRDKADRLRCDKRQRLNPTYSLNVILIKALIVWRHKTGQKRQIIN